MEQRLQVEVKLLGRGRFQRQIHRLQRHVQCPLDVLLHRFRHLGDMAVERRKEHLLLLVGQRLGGVPKVTDFRGELCGDVVHQRVQHPLQALSVAARGGGENALGRVPDARPPPLGGFVALGGQGESHAGVQVELQVVHALGEDVGHEPVMLLLLNDKMLVSQHDVGQHMCFKNWST